MKLKIKPIFVLAGLLLVLSVTAFGITRPTPKIPEPDISAMEVLRKIKESPVAQDNLRGQSWFLVTLEWTTPTKNNNYLPRYGGAVYHVTGDDPQEWAWFLTYVKEGKSETGKKTSEVRVFRVNNNGGVSKLVGTQS